MRDVFEVVTPENVPFEFELASLPARALAWAVDVGVMASIVMAAGVAVQVVAGGLSEGVALGLYFVAVFVVQWGYGTALEWRFKGQTVGKRIFGLRVLTASGTRITWTQSLIRNLVRVIDMAPGLYLVGGVCAFFDGAGRRLGDLAADTVVVRERRSPRPSVIEGGAERYNSLLDDPAVPRAARVITAPEREAMIDLCLRREGLPQVVRSRLFSRLADHLELRLGIERPPFMSHEKYIVHLTSAVLASGGGVGLPPAVQRRAPLAATEPRSGVSP